MGHCIGSVASDAPSRSPGGGQRDCAPFCLKGNGLGLRRPIQEVDDGVSLPCLGRTTQGPRPGDTWSMRLRVQKRDAVPVLERDAAMGHSRDLICSVPERDDGLVPRATVRGFAKIPAAIILLRRGTGGLLCCAKRGVQRRPSPGGDWQLRAPRHREEHGRGLLRR